MVRVFYTKPIIDQAGHVSNQEQPEEFNKHLHAFLTTLGNVDIESLSGKQNER